MKARKAKPIDAAAPPLPVPPLPWTLAVTLAMLAVALLWSYWPLLSEAIACWLRDPQYSHGFLVPIFAGVLLWRRRGQLGKVSFGWSWWGLPLILVGAALRFAGAVYFIEWLALVSLLPTLAGVAVLVGGKGALRWAAPAIVFLIFMIPLPYRFHIMLAAPLQRLAAVSGTYVLQTIGVSAIAEGNTIRLEDATLEIVDACSGLSMMMAFLALCTAVVFWVKRPPLDKGIVLLSALPIAVTVNILRIVVTGVLYEVVDEAVARAVFHDLAGLLMMTAALALVGLELEVLKRSLVELPPIAEPKMYLGPQPIAAKQLQKT